MAMKRQITILTLLLLIVGTLSAQESASYRFTLEDCIRFAFSNNLSASVGQNISNNANGWSTSGNVGVGSSVTIYQGGNINNTIEQNRLNVERNEAQLERYDNQLTTQILQSFLTILGNQELLNYQREVLNTSREQMKQGRQRYKVGTILESDMLLLEAQYYSDSNNVVDTRINIENNLLDLKVLLSMDPADDLTIVSPNTDDLDGLKASLPTEEEAISLAMDYMPDLRVSDYDIRLAEKSVDMARGNRPSSIMNRQPLRCAKTCHKPTVTSFRPIMHTKYHRCAKKPTARVLTPITCNTNTAVSPRWNCCNSRTLT